MRIIPCINFLLQSKIILSFDSKRNKMQSNLQSLQYFIALGLAMTKVGCLKTFLDRSWLQQASHLSAANVGWQLDNVNGQNFGPILKTDLSQSAS